MTSPFSCQRIVVGLVAVLTVAGCTAAGRRAAIPVPARAAGPVRPLPQPVLYPQGYRRALERGSRTTTGEPGPRYWQQWAEYRLRARIDPEQKRLWGEARIRYHNKSPDTLAVLYLQLSQNLHGLGAPRKVVQEVTGGIELARVAVNGHELASRAGDGPGYAVDATTLRLVPHDPLVPGAWVDLAFEWSFRIPQAGASSRMGWDADNLFFLAYWYPQMAVYDDVVGWQTDAFLGRAEFYAGFGGYELTVEAPSGWVVAATGALQNADDVLDPEVLARLRQAEASDTVVRVIGVADFGHATRGGADGYLAWQFVADQVRDVAFVLTRESFWDVTRTPVGDRNGDGVVDYTRIGAFYRELAPRWRNSAYYAQHAIGFFSEYTGYPYPWPHMTAVEGSNIIGGGMEFPMMTLIGDYNARGDSALYFVTAHELGHMWFPMILSNDERRYAWFDEGTTTFNENQASQDFFPGGDFELRDQLSYLQLALAGNEGEVMRRSDFHYPPDTVNAAAPRLEQPRPYSIASYQKPATLLVALRALLGEETFGRAYRKFIADWAFKHPYPWDLFQAFEQAAGRDLDWFWHAWYYETWTLDQAIARVTTDRSATEIVIEDRGLVPMPVHLVVTRSDGEVLRRQVPVETWLAGARVATVRLPPGRPVNRVEIDPDRTFPDTDLTNNVWLAGAGHSR